jgi:hypothetical protein
MSDPPRLWNIVIKIAVEAAGEAEARPIADLLLGKMEVVPAEALEFVRFDNGAWATELPVDDPGSDDMSNPLEVLSRLTSRLVNDGSVQWVGRTDTPFDPDSAGLGQLEWPPSMWAIAGQKQTLLHPSVRAVLLQARRTRPVRPADVNSL